MEITSYYPVIGVGDLQASKRFYTTHFGFVPVFDSDWYVHLTMPPQGDINLALLDPSHPSVPEGLGATARGLLLNFEVADVDAEYDRLRAAGLPMLIELRDEPFGQRHFITRDPDGVMIDVIKPIPPTEEFAAQYDASVLPR